MKSVNTRTIVLLTLICMVSLSSSCPYQKMKPAPDVDKGPPTPAGGDNSCWMATASNMLAGAGYGSGNTVQQRADDIYADMVANYTKVNRGWPDAALQWWLGSNNNTWTNNPYTVVTVRGHKSMPPWNNQNIPQTIANELRRCQFIGVIFTWPTNAAGVVGTGAHATTAWGDNMGKGTLSINPTQMRMTDSDRDGGGDIQIYNYDAYNNPNPGGANEGNGCYFDYSANHPYIRCITLLCPTDDPSDNKQTQMVVGSYKIHQPSETPAIDLHYKVGTDVRILSYSTTIDWDNSLTPSITENDPQRTELTVDWDLQSKPVKQCNWITITTEFVLPGWNAIKYRDVHFTYPRLIRGEILPEFRWELKTPFIRGAERIEDVTGGYVIGAFSLVEAADTTESAVVAEYRFIHQYSFNQDPELHTFLIDGNEDYAVTDLRFGHSYGYLDSKELWAFREWMTRFDERIPLRSRGGEFTIDWDGRLPYPRGVDIRDVIKEIQERK